MAYKVALLGLGRIAYTLGQDRRREQPASHSHAFHGHRGFVLAGGADTDPGRVSAWSRTWPRAVTASHYRDLVRYQPWDVVVVALPEAEHLPAMEVLADYPPRLIVMEKPVAPDLSQARRMEKLVREGGLHVIVNHERRFARNYLLAARLIREEYLGPLRAVRGRILSSVPAVLPDDHRSGQGSLIHDGTHLLDAVEFIAGEQLHIQAVQSGGQEGDCVRTVSVLAHTSGCPVYLEFGLATRHFEFETEWECAEGRLVIGNTRWEIYTSRPSPWYEGFYSLRRCQRPRPPRRSAYFSGMVDACFEFLESGRDPGSGIADSVRYLEYIHNIRKKLEKGRES